MQDKWRVRPNLTLNLGVRYEYWTPMDEKNVAVPRAPPAEQRSRRRRCWTPTPCSTLSAGRPAGRSTRPTRTTSRPNVGFAWDPFKKGKTSIRGGYSISFVNDNMVTTFRNSVISQNSGLSLRQHAVEPDRVRLTSPPTVSRAGVQGPSDLADNFAITTRSFTGMPDPNIWTPYVHQWNIGIQHEIKGTIVAARYIGNRGSALLRSIDYNQVLYNANGFLADFQRAQNNAGSRRRPDWATLTALTTRTSRAASR